jgi:hypothetical protein
MLTKISGDTVTVGINIKAFGTGEKEYETFLKSKKFHTHKKIWRERKLSQKMSKFFVQQVEIKLMRNTGTNRSVFFACSL